MKVQMCRTLTFISPLISCYCLMEALWPLDCFVGQMELAGPVTEDWYFQSCNLLSLSLFWCSVLFPLRPCPSLFVWNLLLFCAGAGGDWHNSPGNYGYGGGGNFNGGYHQGKQQTCYLNHFSFRNNSIPVLFYFPLKIFCLGWSK